MPFNKEIKTKLRFIYFICSQFAQDEMMQTQLFTSDF